MGIKNLYYFRFTGIDPLWEKYIGWTPYQYSGNNPIMFLDWDGNRVRAMDYNSQQNIINSVEEHNRQYVKFDDDGYAYLSGFVAPLKNSNSAKLVDLIETDMEIQVSEIENKKQFTFTIGTLENKPIYSISLKDFFNTPGITLYPSGSNLSAETNEKGKFEVYIGKESTPDNIGSSKNSKGKTTAHELYFHVWRKITGQAVSHDDANPDEMENIKRQAK